jgi:hypothetical protein
MRTFIAGMDVDRRLWPQNATPELADMAINHRTQLPSLFISRLGFAPRFRASGFASSTSGTGIHVNLKYPLCVLNCTQLHNIRITQLHV